VQGGTQLKPIDYLVISPPVEQLEELAARYAHTLPRSIRFFVRGSGMFKRAGSNLLSYLIFEGPYTRALIDMGYQDAKARSAELRAFLMPELLTANTVVNFRRS
jgi:NTE family protein